MAAAARDLAAHRGAALVVAGETLPAAAHTLVAAINDVLGASGASGGSGGTLVYSAPIEADPVDNLTSLVALLDEMKAGKVDLLLVSGVNPVYDAPADLEVAAVFQGSSALRIHHGLHDDETAAYCQWHVPATHYLESWGDARAYDGTVSLVQPLIEPLYGGKTTSEMIGALLGRSTDDAYTLLRETWEAQMGGETFEPAFRKLLHDGLLPASALAPSQPALVVASVSAAAQALASAPAGGELELALRPDPSVLDGRFANNGWLQELPKPITKLTWENAILLSPRTAEKLGVKGNDVAELTAPDGRKLTGPVWLLPGQADGVATVHLGYGRTRAGKVANGIGFSAYAAQTSAGRYGLPSVTLAATGDSAELATTQGHHSIDWMREESEQATERAIVRQATLTEFEQDPHFAHAGAHEGIDVNASFNPGFEYKGYAWGMVIDLNACNGCNACVVACQSENNIPVVGKEQVSRGREMHWIRVDRYYQGDVDEPSSIVSQPIVCMQCEQAPCEVVCPVAATVALDRRPERHGLQPLRRHAVLRQQLPLQGAAVQLPALPGLGDRAVQAAEESRRDRAQPRRDGKVHLLRAAHQPRPDPRRSRPATGRGRRDPDRLPAGLPAAGDFVRQLERPGGESRRRQAEPTQLLAPRGARHPAADHLSRDGQEPQSGAFRMSVAESPRLPVPLVDPPVIAPGHSSASVGDKISSVVFGKMPLWFYVAMAIAFGGAMMLLTALTKLVFTGIGIWGNNNPVGWGFDIINFVWWIGIGHAGTLISAILLLLRQEWRTSINRFAEAMTLFAVACALLYPLFHTGRPWLAVYWLLPYPNTMAIWPNFRSPLIWDVFAVSTYGSVSLVFWFIGLVPDLATFRDRTKKLWQKKIYGALAMGWRGSARHWHNYESAYLLLAGLSTPLVLSVHSVVSFDFASGQVPGWHATIFPPYFVAGAVFAGFAMVLTLMIPLRKAFGLEDFITMKHMDNMGKVMLVTGLIVGYGYIVEIFTAWYSGNIYEWYMIRNRIFGPYKLIWMSLILCNVLAIQPLWFRKTRRSIAALWIISMFVNFGMWFERFVIIPTSLHRDFLPGSWGMYYPTRWDFATFFGSIGLFMALMFLFVRVFPAIAMFEMKGLTPDAKVKEPAHG